MAGEAPDDVRSHPPSVPRVNAYVAEVVAVCAPPVGPLVSLILFGSAATGGYSSAVSDVDLLVVIADGADEAMRRHVRETVSSIETRHGLGKPRNRSGGMRDALAVFADRMTANVQAFFVCTRADLLSGGPGRILGIPRAQALFVDRVAIPSIIGSGRTVWGEDLLAAVPLSSVRRVDVAKAFFGLFNQALFTAVWYPLLPDATRYAMDTLKRSVHNCYFCYHGRSAPLADAVAFFLQRHGLHPVLDELLILRQEYQPSYRFVLKCLPALVRLHARTAREVEFPRAARVGAGSSASGPAAA